MNRTRVKYLGLLLALFAMTAVVACAQSAPRNPPTPVPEPTSTSRPAPTSTPTATPTVVPTSEPATPQPPATATAQPVELSPTPTPTVPGSPTAIPVNNVQTYELTLEIEGISDEAEVRGDTILARGQTSPDAIVSINGVVIPVDETGAFEAPLKLDPGPNVIEVVASDLDGNRVSTVLLVVSLPDEPTPTPTPTPSPTPVPTQEASA